MISATHLHAMAVHFPIALIIIGFLSELIGLLLKKKFWNDVAFLLLVIGTIGAMVSFFSGQSAGDGMEEGSLAIAMELHEDSATLSLVLAIVTSIVYFIRYRKFVMARWISIVVVLLYAAAVVSIARTGYLGGQLVYKHGAGIELGLPDFSE